MMMMTAKSFYGFLLCSYFSASNRIIFSNAFFSGVAVITAERRFFEEHFDCLGAALRNLLKNERNLLRKTMREIY